MSLHTIKNLMGRFSDKEINILYFPSLSVLDSMILNIPVNYYGNTNISHPNLTNLTELSWENYDFIFAHNLSDTIVNLSNTLHIPILYYINSKNKINRSYPKNIVYLYDTTSPIESENVISINLIPDLESMNVAPKQNCVFLNYHIEKINQSLKADIQQKIPDAVFIDDVPESTSALAKIFAQYKVCVDFGSVGHHEALLALQNRCVYLKFNNENTTTEHQYDNLFGVDNLDDETYKNIVTFYNINQFNNDLKLIEKQINKNAIQDLSSVYGFMKFRRYVL